MGVAFWIGRAKRDDQLAAEDAASMRGGFAGRSDGVNDSRPQSLDKWFRPSPNARLTNYSVGKYKVSVDILGNYYIDGLNVSMMMMTEPTRAMALLAKLPMGDQTVAAYLSAFRSWAGAYSPTATNGSKAAAAAAALPPGPARESALEGVALGWARGDPKDALTWASTLPSSDSGVLKDALINAGFKDPALAAQYIGNLTDATARSQAILAISNSWATTKFNGAPGYNPTPDDPAAALAWLDQVATGTAYDTAVKNIFADLAQTDPAAGAALVANITDPFDRSAAIAQMAQRWSASSPQDALAWAASLPDSDATARDAALQSIVASWSGKDLSAAAAFAQSTLSPAAMLTVTPALAKVMAQTDPQGALTWVSSLPDSAAKDQATSNILVGEANSDFSTAWNYAQAMPAGNGRTGAMSSLISTLAKNDPAQAAALSSANGGGLAISAIATNWSKQDPQAASAWINTLPPGGDYDTAATQFALAQMSKDPSTSFNFANSIANNNSRSYYVGEVINSWAAKDPDAALAAAQTANIPDKTRQVLIQKINLAAGK
jgi:hypothetical protein